jgi:hypothetical protein
VSDPLAGPGPLAGLTNMQDPLGMGTGEGAPQEEDYSKMSPQDAAKLASRMAQTGDWATAAQAMGWAMQDPMLKADTNYVKLWKLIQTKAGL